MGQQVLLDTTVLIAALSSSDTRNLDATELFTSRSKSNFAISTVTFTEALIRPYALGPIQGERAEQAISELVADIIPVSSVHAGLAAQLRAKHKTRIPDSMIIATAIIERLELISFDRKMIGIYERIK
jgi:predicted nucleic acid-binding protein